MDQICFVEHKFIQKYPSNNYIHLRGRSLDLPGALVMKKSEYAISIRFYNEFHWRCSIQTTLHKNCLSLIETVFSNSQLR